MKRLLMIAVLLLVAAPVYGQSLVNLQKVSVVVEDLNPTLTAAGIDAEKIKTQVERRLALGGVPVEEEKVGDSVVYVFVSTTKKVRGMFALNVELQLLEPCYPYRDEDRPTSAATWTNSVVTMTDDLRDTQGEINFLVDKFIAAFLKDNPRKGKTEVREN
jgi:hypothetical protein